jgi:hypothetical protein
MPSYLRGPMFYFYKYKCPNCTRIVTNIYTYKSQDRTEGFKTSVQKRKIQVIPKPFCEIFFVICMYTMH